MDKGDKLLTLDEAAEYLDMYRDTVSRKAREGLIRHGKTDAGHYRFKKEWLDEYVLENAGQEA